MENPHSLCMTLKHVDLHGGVTEVPQSEGRVLARGHSKGLSAMGAYIEEFLVVTLKYYTICIYSFYILTTEFTC